MTETTTTLYYVHSWNYGASGSYLLRANAEKELQRRRAAGDLQAQIGSWRTARAEAHAVETMFSEAG